MSTETPAAPLLTSDVTLKDVTLNRDKTVQWVGMVCLQEIGESEQTNLEVPRTNFLAQWHDLLPESWREHASMDLLKV